MSETQDTKFQIELPDGTTLGRNDMVEHRDHGPMYVDQISVGPSYKRVQFQSELGPEGLQLTGDEIREQWGEVLHFDPVKIHEQNPMAERSGITHPDAENAVEADLTVRGEDMENVEVVAMYAHDRIVRAMQAVDRREHPDDVEGIEIEFDWEKILDEETE